MVPIRSTIYEIPAGEFTGLTYTLKLVDASGSSQALLPNYYVNITNGGHSPFTDNDTGGWKPSAHLARVTSDPFGTGDLGTTVGSDEIILTREVSEGDWTGVIEVIECTDAADADGFTLLDVKNISWGASVSAVSSTAVAAWTDIDKVVPYHGGTTIPAGSNLRDSAVGWGTRVFPYLDGATPKLDLQRNLIRSNDSVKAVPQNDTEYIVEYNSNYSVQRVDLDVASTAAYPSWDTVNLITPVSRKNTFVYARFWGEGANDAGWTHVDRPVVLGPNGGSDSATESQIATTAYWAGLEISGKVYVVTNSNQRVATFEYTDLLPRGTSSATAAISPVVDETYTSNGNVTVVAGARSFNIKNVLVGDDLKNSKSWPVHLVTVIPTSLTSVEVKRIRSTLGSPPEGSVEASYIQYIDFAGVAGGDADKIDALASTVTASRTNYIPASNQETVSITATVVDTNGINVGGVTVEGSTDLGNFIIESAVTNSDGVAVLTMSSDAVGTATLTVVANQETAGPVELTAPSITFIELPTNYGARVSLNINQVTDFSEGQPFIDMFLASRQPSISYASGGPFHVNSLEDLDSAGWQKSCTTDQILNYVLRTEGTGSYDSGNYVLTYSGGDLGGDLASQIYIVGGTEISNANKRIEFTWNGISPLFFRIAPTAANMTALNYVSGCQVLAASDEGTYNVSQPFRQKWLDTLEGIEVLRFMSFTQTNNNTVSSWEQRSLTSDSNVNTFLYDPDYSPTVKRRKGVPWEWVIEMSNQVSADAWINVPQRADDNYVSSLATLFRDNLRSDLRVFIEYSNETWNSTFTADNYLADVLVPQYGITAGGTAWLQAYATRSCEVFAIFDTIFSEAPHRVKKVIAGQSANPARVNDILTTDVSIGTSLTGTAVQHTDYYAVAPYVGNNVVETTAQAAYDGMITDFNSAVFNTGGELHQNVAALAALSTDVTIIGYEGGQHLTVQEKDLGNGVIISQTFEVVRDANRLPAMRGFHKDYMDAWDDLTASGMMSIFSHVWQPVESGAWGLLETLDDYGESPQDGNYKWYGWQDWRDSVPLKSVDPTDAPVSLPLLQSLQRNSYSWSAYGSTFASRPGALKRDAPLEALFINTSGAAGDAMPLFSGTAGDNPGYNHNSGIPAGKTLSIFGITAANANSASTDKANQTAVLVVSGNTGAGTTAYQTSSLAWTAKATGPFFLSLDLPVQFDGPCDVWATQLTQTSPPLHKFNYTTLSYVITDSNNLRDT
jgi:hypothetical protein